MKEKKMLRINYGKKLVKDILLAYAFFILKKEIIEELSERESQHLQELFDDLLADLFLNDHNNSHVEKLAKESGTRIINGTAALKDFYTFVGFNLCNIHFMNKNREALEDVVDVAEQLKIYKRQLVDAVHVFREFVITLSEDKIIKFHKNLSATLSYLEKECALKLKEHLEKTTGDDVTMLSSRYGVL
jgi:hypothetical protein